MDDLIGEFFSNNIVKLVIWNEKKINNFIKLVIYEFKWFKQVSGSDQLGFWFRLKS